MYVNLFFIGVLVFLVTSCNIKTYPFSFGLAQKLLSIVCNLFICVSNHVTQWKGYGDGDRHTDDCDTDRGAGGDRTVSRSDIRRSAKRAEDLSC